MSEFPKLDKLYEEARKTREALDNALQEELPPGSTVAVQSGPEFIGRYKVKPYPKYAHAQLIVENEDTGVERRVSYAQVKRV